MSRTLHSLGRHLGACCLAAALAVPGVAQEPEKSSEKAKTAAEKTTAEKTVAEKTVSEKTAPTDDPKKAVTAETSTTAKKKPLGHATVSKGEVSEAPAVASPGDDCAGGVIPDDGTLEGGYGFVPTSKWGSYVQRFDDERLAGRELERVCVCMLATRGRTTEMEFEVVFHKEQNGRPADEPFAKAGGKATDLPMGKESGGRFYPVDLEGVTLPKEPVYVGVRWDPGKYAFTFLCSSKGKKDDGLTPAQGFHRDDRASSWDDVLTTLDPTFLNHRSALLRVVPKKKAEAEPEG